MQDFSRIDDSREIYLLASLADVIRLIIWSAAEQTYILSTHGLFEVHTDDCHTVLYGALSHLQIEQLIRGALKLHNPYFYRNCC